MARSAEGTGRQRVEEALSESQERFQAIFSQAAVGIAQIGLDKEWLLVNNRLCQMLGYSEAELRRKTLSDITHPDDNEESLAGRRKLLAGEIFSHTMEKRYIRKDGSVFWGRLNRSLVRDHDNRPKYFVSVVEDITEKIQAERALRVSEQRLTLAQNAAQLGVWDCDLRTNITVISGEYAKLHGLAPVHALLTHEQWLELLHPDDRERVQRLLRESLEHTHFWDTEFRVVWPDGTVHWLLGKGKVFVDDFGLPVRIAGVSIDITERKRTEEALRQSEERFRLAVQATNDAIWDIDLVSGTVRWNETYAALYGRPPETSNSWQWWIDRIHAEDRERTTGGLRSAINGGESTWTSEYRFQRVNGAWANIYDRAYIARDASGKAWRVIGAMQDLTERKEGEAALRESEERFRNLANTSPVMIWVVGSDKRATFFNRRWLDFTGHTMGESIGDGWNSALHDEDRASFRNVYSSSIDARQEFRSVFRLRTADGEYRWVLTTGVPYFASDGVFTGYIISCIDMTEQKLIQERLQASEAQLKDAQRLAKVGSWERNIDTAISQWSDENRRILGVPNDAPANFSTFINCIYPKDREKVLEVERKVRTSGALGEVQYRIIRPNGELRFVHSILEALRDDQGKAVRIVGASQDITEQVKAAELLRESEMRLKNAERLAHVGHWSWDLTSNQVIWSEECFRIFGRPTDDQPNYEEFLKAVLPQDRELVERAKRERLTEKSGTSIEYRIARPDGDVRVVRSVSEVVLDDENRPVRIFGAVQDITDLRRAQEESFARQKLETLGTLANGIAHDFNNLLGGVLAQAELAQAECDAGSLPEEELTGIRKVAIRGSEIVRQLMVYAGKESEVLEQVDVSQIVKEMLELLQVSVSKRVVLETNLDRDLPSVRANVAQVRQILMNLITNASEAIGDQNGLIRVATRCVNVGKASNRVISHRLPEGDYVELTVSDTGCGISQEALSRIFDPFFTTKSAGHGLGLAVVEGIVRGSGGAIDVASEPGKGTTLQVMLPCAAITVPATGDSISDDEEPVRPFHELTLMVVEDEDLLRQAVVKMLRKAGFDLLEAANGSTAIDILRAKGRKIDLILLDATIPGVSSEEVANVAAKAWPDARVILTSAYSPELIASMKNAPRVQYFIRKPFQFGNLVQTLRSAAQGMGPKVDQAR